MTNNWVEDAKRYASELSALALMSRDRMNADDAFLLGAAAAINPHSMWNCVACDEAEAAGLEREFRKGGDAGYDWLLSL